MKTLKAVAARYNATSLILRIVIGLAVGAVLALAVPGAGWVEEFGSLFVGALKGIAPVLVFVIVASALAQGTSKLDRRFGTVIWLYMLTTFLPAAILLSVMSALGACGASGVAGGSLLLIPMACSLFGISNDIAMQVVGVGFIIGVVQDSVETALNSAGDVEFAATAEYHQWRKEGKPLPAFLCK